MPKKLKTLSSSIWNVYSWFLREETQGICLEEYLLKQGRESTTNSTVTRPMLQFIYKEELGGKSSQPCAIPTPFYPQKLWKLKLRIRLYFLYSAPWKLNRGMGTHVLTLPNNLLGRIPAQCPNWSISWSLNLNLFFTTLNKIQRNLEITRDLKIEVFRHCQRTANIKKSHDQGFAVRFVVWGSR